MESRCIFTRSGTLYCWSNGFLGYITDCFQLGDTFLSTKEIVCSLFRKLNSLCFISVAEFVFLHFLSRFKHIKIKTLKNLARKKIIQRGKYFWIRHFSMQCTPSIPSLPTIYLWKNSVKPPSQHLNSLFDE